MNAVANPKRRSSDTPLEARDPGSMQLYAMPPGESFQRLRSDYVALDKMLATLAADRFTGYLRVHGEGINGVLLLAEGGVVETLYDMAPLVVTGRPALEAVTATVGRGEGELDIVPHSLEIVIGVYQLLTAPSLYENLYARFVDAPALLEHLGESQLSGSLVVTNGEEQGVILLRDGDVLTAYTDGSPQPESAADLLERLCQDPATALEVRSGPLPAGIRPIAQGGASAV